MEMYVNRFGLALQALSVTFFNPAPYASRSAQRTVPSI